jgi:serine/threonine protein kinase
MDAPAKLHPTDETLSSFGLGKLDDAAAESVSRHLENCPECRKRVAEMPDDSFLGRFRAAPGHGHSVSDRSQPDASQKATGPSTPAPPPACTLPPGLAEQTNYEIKRELGRGGMGVVYLAHNKLMGRDEVLKVVGSHLLNRTGVRDRFLREIRFAAKLHHTNIVTAYSAIPVGESLVLSMEYVEGYDLAQVVKGQGPLRVQQACNFVHQAALGLQHAHERGMVHRDIKPSNLMVAREGNKPVIKVLDFGLAKVTSEGLAESGLTHEGQMLGTPDYIAPEQIRDARSADIRADIYSLACTLFYLLAGRPPFRGDSLWDLYQAHFSMDASPLNLLRPEVPVELAALVAKMMAKEPERRFQTPGEVAEALLPFFRKSGQVSRLQMADVSVPAAGATGAPLPSSSRNCEKTILESPVPTQAVTGNDSLQSLMGGRQPEVSAGAACSPARRHRWLWPSAAAGLLLACFLIAAIVGVLKVRTKNGVLVFEDLPPNAVVEIDGNIVTVSASEGKPAKVELPPGKRYVRVTQGTNICIGEDVTVKSGKEFKLKVRRELSALPSTGRGDNAAANGSTLQDADLHPSERPLATMAEMMARGNGTSGMMGMGGREPEGSSAMRGMMAAGTTADPAQNGMMGMMGRMTGMMGAKSDEPPPLTKATQAKLDRRIAMHFPNKSPLRNVLAYIKDATKEGSGAEIPIYLDLAAIDHSEKALNSPVSIDLADAPLKGSLEYVLKQAVPELAYCVKDGLLFISTPSRVESEKDVPEVPPSDDAPRSQAIAAKLETSVPIRFRNPTTLHDALKALKNEAIEPERPSIQIYVNPNVYGSRTERTVGPLQSSKTGETSKKSKPLLVTMELEKVPLRTTLRLLLAQVGLEFSLKKGVVIVNRKADEGRSGMGMMGMMMGGSDSAKGMAGKMGGAGSMIGAMSSPGGFGGMGMMGQNPEDLDPRSKTVVARLGQPISMKFPNLTPLRDVLKYVRQSTSLPNQPAIPVYLDPVGIGDTEKAQNTMVSIELDDIPLNDTLELLLEQAGLAHCSRDGVLFISTPAQVAAERAARIDVTADDEQESRAIVAELGKPRSVRLSHKVTLKEAVEHVKSLTRGNNDTAIPIVFDPPDSQDVQKAKATLVMMDVEHVPLRTSLRLLLAQAGLEFSIRKGILFINKTDGAGRMMGASEMMRGMMGGAGSEVTKGSNTQGGMMMNGGGVAPTTEGKARGARKSKRSTPKTGKSPSVGGD